MASAGDTWVVAVSGGPDSMCLLDVLHSLSSELGISLHAAYLHHHMREQASGDAAMVQSYAEGLGVGFTIGHAQVNEIAESRRIGVEEAGRDARYAFLREVQKQTAAKKIALGHNLNDQAETVIMRLLRGAGTQGLAGIPPANEDIVRPLIGVSRHLIEEYCKERNIPTIVDVYNLDPRYTRNAVRLSVLPDLEKRFNPSLVENLGQVAQVLRWDSALLEQLATDAFLGISVRQGRLTSVDRTALASLPPAISSRVLELAWRECSSSTGNLPLLHIQELLESSENVNSFPEGVIAEKSGERVVFYPRPPSALEVSLPSEGEVSVPELGVTFVTRIKRGSSGLLREEACKVAELPSGYPLWLTEPFARVDCETLKGPLVVRTRRPGDRMRPLGMGGSEQKVQDLLIQRRVPKFARDFIPIVESGGDIVCVAGLRLDERFKVSGSTTCMTEVEVRPYLRCSRNYASIWGSYPTSGRVYS